MASARQRKKQQQRRRHASRSEVNDSSTETPEVHLMDNRIEGEIEMDEAIDMNESGKNRFKRIFKKVAARIAAVRDAVKNIPKRIKKWFAKKEEVSTPFAAVGAFAIGMLIPLVVALIGSQCLLHKTGALAEEAIDVAVFNTNIAREQGALLRAVRGFFEENPEVSKSFHAYTAEKVVS